ncbi:MAG: family 2 glycosyl transferase [Parcubacteria group bacterium Gr01-1014_19]|nr:MAG: family 2 glycosyl transferase [Parcubacteria group bacterium Gr01-1014_19]
MSISFIIPARNEEAYIGETIKHILAQPEELVKEIIVVDNGSADRTVEIAAMYPKVKVLREPVPGTNRARQTGFAYSTGEIIGFIDADNWLAPNWAETTISYLSKPGVAGVAGVYKYRDVGPVGRFFTLYGFLAVAYPVYFIVHYLLRRGSVVQGGNFAANRWALEKIGGLDVSYVFYGDDAHTGKQLRKVGKVLFTGKLVTEASARRFKKHGYFKVVSRYFLNFIWVILFNRPFSKK